MVLHRISGDTGFEFGTEASPFSLTYLVSFKGCRPLKDPLNSSTSFWLRFLGPLQTAAPSWLPATNPTRTRFIPKIIPIPLITLPIPDIAPAVM